MLVECSVSQHHITSIGISKKIGSKEWKQKDWRSGCRNKSGRKKSKDGFGSGVEKKMWKQRKAIVRKQWKWKQADWKQRADSGCQQGVAAADT